MNRSTYKFGLRRERIVLTDIRAGSENGKDAAKLAVSLFEGSEVVGNYEIAIPLSDLEAYEIKGTFEITNPEIVQSVERHGKALNRFVAFLIEQINQNDIFAPTLIDILGKLPDEIKTTQFHRKVRSTSKELDALKTAETDARGERLKRILSRTSSGGGRGSLKKAA